MLDKEKEFIVEVNVDKARNKTVLPIILMVLSLFTYVIPLIFGEFDFGMCFEILSLIFLLIARSYMSKYDVNRAKRYVIAAMATIGWILIYDMIISISLIQDPMDLIFEAYHYFYSELLSLLYLSILFTINKNLSKADNPQKYKESTDWFYEKYEEKEK